MYNTMKYQFSWGKVILIIYFIFLIFVQLSLAQWVQVNNGLGEIWTAPLASNGSYLFSGTRNGVYLTTNNGDSWTHTSLNNHTIYSLLTIGNNIFAGTEDLPVLHGLYLSTNNGTTWTQTSLNNVNVVSLAVNGNNIFAGTENHGVYLSTNNGTTWTQTSLNYNGSVYGLTFSGNNIFAGTCNPGYGVYFSTNNGTLWTQTSLNNQCVWSLAASVDRIFSGTQSGGFISTNNGTNWSQTAIAGWVSAIVTSGNNIFAGTVNGVYVSNNNGATWILRNEGLVNVSPNGLCISNNYIFVSSGGNNSTGGVWRRPLNEIIGIQQISNEVPKDFLLFQNYPNPFNPSTKIKFSLPRPSEGGEHVKLIIYDYLGREAETLVNEHLKPGTYEIEWNASKYSSGVYFYKIISGSFAETKKMILMK